MSGSALALRQGSCRGPQAPGSAPLGETMVPTTFLSGRRTLRGRRDGHLASGWAPRQLTHPHAEGWAPCTRCARLVTAEACPRWPEQCSKVTPASVQLTHERLPFPFCSDRGFKRKPLSLEITGCKIKILPRNKQTGSGIGHPPPRDGNRRCTKATVYGCPFMRVGCPKNTVPEIKAGHVLLGGDAVPHVNLCCLHPPRAFLERAPGPVTQVETGLEVGTEPPRSRGLQARR